MAAAVLAQAAALSTPEERLERLRRDLQRLDQRVSSTSPSTDDLVPLSKFALPDRLAMHTDTDALIAACCRPQMTPEEATASQQQLQAHLTQTVLGSVNDILDDCRVRLNDLWAQLLAEIKMREASEVQQLKLEQELEAFREEARKADADPPVRPRHQRAASAITLPSSASARAALGPDGGSKSTPRSPRLAPSPPGTSVASDASGSFAGESSTGDDDGRPRALSGSPRLASLVAAFRIAKTFGSQRSSKTLAPSVSDGDNLAEPVEQEGASASTVPRANSESNLVQVLPDNSARSGAHAPAAETRPPVSEAGSPTASASAEGSNYGPRVGPSHAPSWVSQAPPSPASTLASADISLEEMESRTADSTVAAAPTGRRRFRGFSLKSLISRNQPSSQDYRRQLRRLKVEREQLRQELDKLTNLYCTMVDSRSMLFFEKEQLTAELETLTCELFEEANRMVAHEARLRDELQRDNQRLSEKLETLITTLQTELSHHRDRVSPGEILAARTRRLASAGSGIVQSPSGTFAQATTEMPSLGLLSARSAQARPVPSLRNLTLTERASASGLVLDPAARGSFKTGGASLLSRSPRDRVAIDSDGFRAAGRLDRQRASGIVRASSALPASSSRSRDAAKASDEAPTSESSAALKPDEMSP